MYTVRQWHFEVEEFERRRRRPLSKYRINFCRHISIITMLTINLGATKYLG